MPIGNRARLGGLPLRCWTALEHAHDVGLLHDQELLAIKLDLGAGPFAEQDKVPGLNLGNDALAVLIEGARTDGDNFALLRLLLGGIGDDDAAGALLILGYTAHDHAVAKRTEFHADCLLRSEEHTSELQSL